MAASAKKMSRVPDRKKPSRSSSSSSSSSSWVARSMGFYYHSSTTSSSKSRAQATDGKDSNVDKQSNGSSTSKKNKKRSISIGRSLTCAGRSSICSTKESSVMSRDHGDRDRGAARSASSRSLRAPDVDAVYAAAVSATSSFNSETTAATTAVTTSSSSPLSSALSSPLSSIGGSSFRGVQQIRKLSRCYECHSVFDPRSFAAAATAAFPCADCDEVFNKAESLELHRATRHAGIYILLFSTKHSKCKKQKWVFNLYCSNFSNFLDIYSCKEIMQQNI